MGRLRSSSSLGDYMGKVGTVILTSWLSIGVMKSLHLKRKTRHPSPEELTQRALFTLITKFLSKSVIKRIIELGYQKPKKPKMTPLNAATSYNLIHAVVGNVDDPHLDLALIKFSKPIRATQKAWKPVMFPQPGKNITVSWELNPFPQKCTQLDDEAILIFYNKTSNAFEVTRSLRRDDTTGTHYLKQGAVGDEVGCYLMMVSSDKKLVAETQFLGMTNLLA